MPAVNIVFAVICWMCSFIFIAIAVWAFKRRDPMHFWSGSTVSPEEIADIPSYNRANGIMWTAYATCIALAGLVSLFSVKTGGIMLGIIFIPGIGVLIAAYRRIYNKYRSTSFTGKNGISESKTPKTAIAAMILVTATVFSAVGVLLAYGEKDPEVRIFDDHMQINSMYGLSIDFSEITGISLMEKSVKDIDIGKRLNGYGGIGDALKGNFRSDTLGEILLFVRADSSPTIRIGRNGKKDVYINFKNSEETRKLYRELTGKVPLE